MSETTSSSIKKQSKQEKVPCNICCENYNNSTRAKITCSYCSFEVCRSCCETYMLSQDVCKCINTSCDKPFTQKFIRDNFTQTFISGPLKKHIEEILFQKEVALMPSTQCKVELKIKREQSTQRIKELDVLIQELYRERSMLAQFKKDGTYSENFVSNYTCFTKKCGDYKCKGFISSQWKCGVCQNYTCSKCHEFVGEHKLLDSHECIPENVSTVQLMNKDTKPCPGCSFKIYKIDGCDQMWCTNCHTAFSWKNGNIQKNIHNPHYYEWMRRTGGLARQPGDIPCGRELSHNLIIQLCSVLRTCGHTNYFTVIKPPNSRFSTGIIEYSEDFKFLTKHVERAMHISEVDIRERQNERNHSQKNEDNRIAYMRNHLSEEGFKASIIKNEMKYLYNLEMVQVLQLYCSTVTDISYRFIDNMKASKPNECDLSIIYEIDKLIEYCNELFLDICYSHRRHLFQFKKDGTYNVSDFIVNKKYLKKINSTEKDDPNISSSANAVEVEVEVEYEKK